MRIIALPEVEEYLTDLINILYEKKYFSFEENAIKYVQDLIEDIRANLPNKIKKPAPAYFERYGHNMSYAVFRKNKLTQWYVFFTIYRDQDEIVYLIRYVANNHTIAQYL